MGQIATCVGEDEAATASPYNPHKLDGLHPHPLCRSFREAFYHQEEDTKRALTALMEGATQNVYNYETDQVALGLVIKLMAVSLRNKMCDIEPELVCRFDLIQWQRDHA